MIEERKIRLEWWKLIVGSIIAILVVVIPLILNSNSNTIEIPKFTLSNPIFTTKTNVNIYARNDIANKKQNIHIEWDGFLFRDGAKISKNNKVTYAWEFIPEKIIKEKELLSIGQHKVRFSFNNSDFSDYLQVLLSEQSTVTIPIPDLEQVSGLPSTPSVKRALVIGNNEYWKHSLSNSVNDAKLIALTLREAGFIVTLGLNLTEKEMRNRLNIYNGKIGKNDTSIIYFSGLGLQLEGTDYLIPIDAKISDARDIKDNAISMNEITKINQKLKNKVILYATLPEMTASENKNHGLFSYSLAKYITKPNIELSLAFHKVIEEVKRNTSGEQVPLLYSNATDNLILNNKNSNIGQSASILILDAGRSTPFKMRR